MNNKILGKVIGNTTATTMVAPDTYTKEEIDTKFNNVIANGVGAGSGYSEIMYVPLRLNYGTLTSEVTFEQINTAISAGKLVVVNYEGTLYYPLNATTSQIVLYFFSMTHDRYIGLTCDNGNVWGKFERPYDSEIFYVNVTETDGTFTSDKKVGEIYAAYQEGKAIIGVHGAYILHFISAIETECLFAEVTLDGKHIVYDVFDNGDNVGNVAVSTFDYATKTYVKDAIADSEEVLIVHVNIDENGTITKDKTYAEVKAAIDAGKIVKIRRVDVRGFVGLSDLSFVGIAQTDTGECLLFQLIQERSYFTALWFADESIEYHLNDYLVSDDKNMIDNRITSLETDVGNIETALAETEAIAKGRATGYVFDTVDDMYTWLADSNNIANIVLGDNLYIKAKDVPDYWWDGFAAQELETQKVNLTEYATKEWSENYINETILGGAW